MRSSHIAARLRILLLGILLTSGSGISGCSPAANNEAQTTGPQHAATRIAERGETIWDLVALGDSTAAGAGVPSADSYVQVYAGFIEQDLGVTVNVHSYATSSRRMVADWVEVVQSNEALRDDLRNAEVITIWLGSHDLLRAVGLGRGGPCYPRAGEADLDCLREMTDRMQEGFDLLLSEIVALASPAQTLILIAEIGIPPPMVAAWEEDGSLALLKRHAYEVWRDHLIQAAEKHRVHVVPTYKVLNGPNGDRRTPAEYLQSDGIHPNAKGHKLIADVHRGVGYEYSSP